CSRNYRSLNWQYLHRNFTLKRGTKKTCRSLWILIWVSQCGTQETIYIIKVGSGFRSTENYSPLSFEVTFTLYSTLPGLFTPESCVQVFLCSCINESYSSWGSFPIHFAFNTDNDIAQCELLFFFIVTPISC
ncbi:hypothetical protein BY457_1011, partial [Marinilabilia salmonicolor]